MRDYLKRAARVDELNGHPSGSGGPMVTALKGYNGGRVLVLVMGAFAEALGDVSRICDIIAHDLARTHVSYYSDDAKRTNGMYMQRIQKGFGAHGAPRLGPSPTRPRPGPRHPRPGAPRRQRRSNAGGRGRPGRSLLL